MKKRKILLLSDDLRLPSGVGNVSKNIVLGTVDTFDWVQVGAAVKHPDQGKVLDLSDDAKKITGVEDASVKVYPWSGYGNPDLVRQLMNQEQPDAILHFTDPRQWLWLYNMEHEIRQNIPIFFYHIWDNVPDPQYNRNYYESCDWIGCISKQTYGITKRVWGLQNRVTWKTPTENQVDYIPHGIDTVIYKPLDEDDGLMIEMRNQLFEGDEVNFTLLYNSRNIRRKMTPDVIEAFRRFLDGLDEESRRKCRLILHTTPVDDNGTDLPKIINHLMPEYKENFIISGNRLTEQQLNAFYNIADATILISSNEGFGLGTAESISAGTPIIVNVTGGLQDQCGFKLNGKYLTPDDYVNIQTIHDHKIWKDKVQWGEWATPIWSKAINITGSPPTPYIYDDRVDIDDVADAIKLNYDRSREERKRRGLVGREWLKGDGNLNKEFMCNKFKEYMNRELDNWKPRKKYEVYSL